MDYERMYHSLKLGRFSQGCARVFKEWYVHSLREPADVDKLTPVEKSKIVEGYWDHLFPFQGDFGVRDMICPRLYRIVLGNVIFPILTATQWVAQTEALMKLTMRELDALAVLIGTLHQNHGEKPAKDNQSLLWQTQRKVQAALSCDTKDEQREALQASGLSVRILSICSMEGIKTLTELFRLWNSGELFAMRNFGVAVAVELWDKATTEDWPLEDKGNLNDYVRKVKQSKARR
jgi:hypothetical protein